VLLLLSMASADAQAVSLRWTRTYNGARDDYDRGSGVAVAADGSIYVTGSTQVTGQMYNLLLQKYR
jgi:hypothetical protein